MLHRSHSAETVAGQVCEPEPTFILTQHLAQADNPLVEFEIILKAPCESEWVSVSFICVLTNDVISF